MMNAKRCSLRDPCRNNAVPERRPVHLRTKAAKLRREQENAWASPRAPGCGLRLRSAIGRVGRVCSEKSRTSQLRTTEMSRSCTCGVAASKSGPSSVYGRPSRCVTTAPAASARAMPAATSHVLLASMTTASTLPEASQARSVAADPNILTRATRSASAPSIASRRSFFRPLPVPEAKSPKVTIDAASVVVSDVAILAPLRRASPSKTVYRSPNAGRAMMPPVGTPSSMSAREMPWFGIDLV